MAGFKGAGSDDEVIASINMVPMIDVVLVLLIIFIVTATAIVKAAIAVDLPKAATSESALKPPLSVVLSCVEKQVSNESEACTPGAIVVDKEAVVDLSDPNSTIDPLVDRIRAEVAAAEANATSEDDTGLTVLVTADRDIRFQHVVWLMDILKNEGVSAIMFNSELFTKKEDARRLPGR